MTLRTFAFIYGLAFLLVGLLGLALHGPGSAHAMLLGVFPVNGLHNLAHTAIGLAGLLTCLAGASACRVYAQIVGSAYLLLAVVGVVSPDLFGLMPIGGADIGLHLVAGGVALYFGLRQPARAAVGSRAGGLAAEPARRHGSGPRRGM